MNREEIRALVRMFVEGARRVVEAGIDGIKSHSGNGYVFTQFISSAINDRNDGIWGLSGKPFRFRREVIEGIRAAGELPARYGRGYRPFAHQRRGARSEQQARTGSANQTACRRRSLQTRGGVLCICGMGCRASNPRLVPAQSMHPS